MNENKKFFLWITAFVLMAVVAIFYFNRIEQPLKGQQSYGYTSMLGSATTTNAIAVTSSTRALATTTNALNDSNSHPRVYATICNPNANPVYLNLDRDKVASIGANTYIIAAAAGYNVCQEITNYSGSITASSTGETSTTITVKDYVQ